MGGGGEGGGKEILENLAILAKRKNLAKFRLQIFHY